MSRVSATRSAAVQLDHQILLARAAFLGCRAPRPVGDRSTRPLAFPDRVACRRVSTRTGLRRLRAPACGVDTLDRLEVTMPLAHLPAQRSKRAAFETERPIAPAAVPKVVAKIVHFLRRGRMRAEEPHHLAPETELGARRLDD